MLILLLEDDAGIVSDIRADFKRRFGNTATLEWISRVKEAHLYIRNAKEINALILDGSLESETGPDTISIALRFQKKFPSAPIIPISSDGEFFDRMLKSNGIQAGRSCRKWMALERLADLLELSRK